MIILPMPEKHKVVAVIPAFNEEKTIEDVVLITNRYVDEVIVIDDGSNDSTVTLAEKVQANVYRHPRNLGYGEAVKTGLSVALKRGASVSILLDADGQHNPHYIPFVFEPIMKGSADLVIASRFLYHIKCIPFIRRLGISFVNNLFNWLFSCLISDTQSGFRAFSFRAMNSLKLQEKGMGISIEILAKAIENKLMIKDIPVPCSFGGPRARMLGLIAQGLIVVRSIIRYRCELRSLGTDASRMTLKRGKTMFLRFILKSPGLTILYWRGLKFLRRAR
ncbi:MAG: glycosyltransferase family 2 protein [Firmicutes bacterium]|nr:glycosyltransferase family 2 protein [Bacillota bacterium]